MEWSDLLTRAVLTFNAFILIYFVVLNTIYLVLVSRHQLREVVSSSGARSSRTTARSCNRNDLAGLRHHPAHNEERTIVETIRR
jgi:hypothetical protein